MNEMNITSAQYNNSENTSVVAVIDGITMYVPTEVGNAEYDEIMKQVAAGDLTIADAD